MLASDTDLGSPRRVYRLGFVFDGQRIHKDAALCIEQSKIAFLGPWADIPQTAVEPGSAQVVPLPNSLCIPGLCLAHHHAYSALARGMAVTGPMRGFKDVLEKLWWPLDRSLTMEAVKVSALVTAVDCIRCGVTAVADHHASPDALMASLESIGQAFRMLGLRGILCFEISDRYGETATRQALEENLSFASAHENDPQLRGLLGLHASFTLSDDSLRFIATHSPTELPIHVHVAEDRCDVEHAIRLGHRGPLARLAFFGLLRPCSLLAHGIHLTDEEISLLQTHDAYLVHNPESNANNRVGSADIARFPTERVLLGTDGMGSSLLGTLRAAFLGARSTSVKPDEAMGRCVAAAMKNTPAYFERIFSQPMGRIEVGARADLSIFDYPSPTPLSEDNLMGHLLYGLSSEPHARYVYANGHLALDNGTLVGVDLPSLLEWSRKVATELWKRFAVSRRESISRKGTTAPPANR